MSISGQQEPYLPEKRESGKFEFFQHFRKYLLLAGSRVGVGLGLLPVLHVGLAVDPLDVVRALGEQIQNSLEIPEKSVKNNLTIAQKWQLPKRIFFNKEKCA